MKLLSAMVWMSILALFSCNSSEQDSQEETFPIKFSLLLKEEILSFPETRGIPPLDISEPVVDVEGKDAGSLAELCATIEYIVFKEGENTPFRKVTFTREEMDFGKISDQLPRGEYEFILVAHNASSLEISGNHLIFDRVTDTFHYAFYLEIVPGDRIEETITLYRIVSKIEFVATDLVPEDAKELTIQLSKYPRALDLSTGCGVVPEGDTPFFTYPLAGHIGKTDITHAFFTFVPEGETFFTANLNTRNTEGGILHERTVEKIQPIVNKIIRYKGRLYNPSGSDEKFTVILDENGKWSETIEKELED